MYFEYKYLSTDIKDFASALNNLVETIKKGKCNNIIRLVFFSDIINNEEYNNRKDILDNILENNFSGYIPTYALVAQKVGMYKSVAVEIQSISGESSGKLKYKNYKGLNYVLFENKDDRFLFVSGIYENSRGLSVKKLSEKAFNKLLDILKNENYSIANIVRQWNYIENITNCTSSGKQNYQEFNNVRSVYYGSHFEKTGYPAATGIGVKSGGIMIDVDVFNNSDIKSLKIDNKKQRPAYSYSKDVLIGIGLEQTTPKFERARLLKFDNETFEYISGTAAISGEKTIGTSFKEQLDVTLNNIAELLDSTLFYSNNGLYKLKSVRIYLKSLSYQMELLNILNDKLKGTEYIVLETDICRTNLLLEIEGNCIT